MSSKVTLSCLVLMLGGGLSFGCGSRVEVQSEPNGSGGRTGSQANCVPCSNFGITEHVFNDRPLCEGEAEKFQALLDCACQESTCLSDGCSEAPSPVASGLCDGSKVDGFCQRCLRDNCADAYRACKDPGS